MNRDNRSPWRYPKVNPKTIQRTTERKVMVEQEWRGEKRAGLRDDETSKETQSAQKYVEVGVCVGGRV